MQYAINYGSVLMMQQLGMSLAGLAVILSFLGLAPGVGGMAKWKDIQDAVGASQQEVCEEVLCANIEKEVAATKADAHKKAEEWAKTEGKQDDEEAKAVKVEEFLAYINGLDGQVRVGLTATMDGAWQKRSSGSNYNSRTGHNFAIGGFSGMIIALVVFSKHCRMCEVAKKKNKEPKEHRCAQNFPMEKSSKSMEGIGSVEHCKAIFSRAGNKVRGYIRTIVTDDDSTTRANLRHSLKEELDAKYGDGGWQKTDHWPRVDNDPKKAFVKDNGLMPLWAPAVLHYLCDISHRVKVIGSMCYDIKQGKDPSKEKKRGGAPNQKKKPWHECTSEEQEHRSKNKMQKYDCEKIKVLAGYYLHGNRHLPFGDYFKNSHCIYLHHFNDQSLCHSKWCKVKRCHENGTDLPADYCVNNKFRDKEEHAELFGKVKAGMQTYLTTEALQMCYHPFCTQKNESLNRKSTATAPKDRFYGGTKTLSDRLRMVVIEDTLGYVEAINRVLGHLGIAAFDTLTEWSRRKDSVANRQMLCREKKENKINHAQKRKTEMNEGYKASKKAKASYGTGIAINDPSLAALGPDANPTTGLSTSRVQQKTSNNELPHKRAASKPCSCGA